MISDVHGNVFALRAVLAAVAGLDVDALVNLGDHLSGAVAPAETAELLQRTPALSVRGNHDRFLVELPRERMGRADRAAFDGLTPSSRAWLAALPQRLDVAPGVLAFHGVPGDDEVMLLETITRAAIRPATVEEVSERLGDWSDGYALMLCGHSHLQRSVQLPGGTLVVNPGSVGWPALAATGTLSAPIEAGTPHARFAVADDAAGRWTADFHAVKYPWDDAAALAERNGRADIARQLRTGRV